MRLLDEDCNGDYWERYGNDYGDGGGAGWYTGFGDGAGIYGNGTGDVGRSDGDLIGYKARKP